MLKKLKNLYIKRITSWVLNLTHYQGEKCKGFQHTYDIYMKDVIPGFVIVSLHVDWGTLWCETWKLPKGDPDKGFYAYDLSIWQLRKIYRTLKSIDLFK